MPGKWVGGKGSVACPVKGQYLEAQVFDAEGKDQGTVFLEVKRLYGTGSTGRTFLGDYITASDPFYRHWASTVAAAPTTIDGSYHLCRGDPTSCGGGPPEGMVIHLGKWRTWKEEELLQGEIEGLHKDGRRQMERFFKAHRNPRERDGEGLPWGGGGLDLGKSGEDEKKKKAEQTEEKEVAKKAKKAEQEEAKSKITALEKELLKLRKQVADRGDSAEEPDKSKKKRKTAGREKSKKERLSILPMKKSRRSPGGDDSGDGDEDGSGSPSSPGDDTSSEEGKDKKKKKRPKKRTKKPGRKDTKSDKKRRKEKKDRGPFGVDETEKWPDESRESISDSEDSSEGSVFRKASPSMSQHLKLVRYAKRHPGRMAARLLRKMSSVTGFGGGAAVKMLPEKGGMPAAAHTYFLAVMTPSLKDRWTQRTQRELKICSTLLDLMATEDHEAASDIIAQRIKALEKSVQDGNSWRRAMVEPEENLLVDRGEETMMAKELEMEERLRSRGGWSEWPSSQWNRKGKGQDEKGKKGDGKSKGGWKGKGKSKTPAEQAATKAPEA